MNLPRIVLLFQCLLCTSIFCKAQWNELGLPYGYDKGKSFIAQNGEMYFKANDDIYFSDDLGENWTKTGFPNLPFDFDFTKIIETNTHDILLWNNNDVWEFDRNTISWELKLSPAYPLINVDHNGYIWCKAIEAGKSGYYLSKDKGITYIYFESPVPVMDCYTFNIESHTDNHYYVASYCGLNNESVYSFDDNAAFLKIGNHASTLAYFIIPETGTVLSKNATDSLSRSTDSGNTFKYITLPTGYTAFGIKWFRMMNNGNILMFTGHSFLLSQDDGVSWQIPSEYIVNGLSSPINNAEDLSLINSGDTLIAFNYSCEKEGICTSLDNGASWQCKNNKFKMPFLRKLLPDDKGGLYAITCTDTTAVFSDDDGVSWTPFMVTFNGKNYGIKNLALGTGGEMYAYTQHDMFKSTDGGISFSKIILPAGIDKSEILTTPNGYIYLIAYGSYYISKDGGNTFISIDLWAAGVPVFTNIDDDGFLYLSDNKGVMYIYDPVLEQAGEVIGGWANRFAVTGKGTVYLAYNNATSDSLFIYRSDDKLITYSKINGMKGSAQGMFIDQNNSLYIYNGESIFYSANGTDKFELFTKLPPGNSDQALQFLLSPLQELLVYRNAPSKIYRYLTRLDKQASIQGRVYWDSNNDCNSDISEPAHQNIQVNITGSNSLYTYSDTDGKYTFLSGQGNYLIQATPPNALWKSCPPVNLSIPDNQTDTIKLDLGLQALEACPYLTVQAQMPIVRRCFDNYLYIKYCNEGTAHAQGSKLKIVLSDKMEYKSASLIPFTVSGQELIFELGILEPGQCGDIILNVMVKCEADLAEELCITAEMSPVISCSTILPDLGTIEKCVEVKGSFDPNDKTAYINGKLANGHSEMNQDVEYLIRFQNTGTDTAFRVIVVDDIPTGFDISTIKPLNSSHPYTLEVESRKLKFIFDPIVLPDSNINEPASHGFIAFKISPLKDLLYGTKLNNVADIYFDFNTAVATNIAFLTVTPITKTSDPERSLSFSYYPNPTSGELSISFPYTKSQTYTLMITNMLGYVLLKETWKGSSYQLNSGKGLRPGMYFISVADGNDKKGHGKLVVE